MPIPIPGIQPNHNRLVKDQAFRSDPRPDQDKQNIENLGSDGPWIPGGEMSCG